MLAKTVRFVVDMLIAAICVWVLLCVCDALTYPIMDLGNALTQLFGR